MALPKLQTSEYTLTLPSTQEEIKFRPFLVKEQKLLMIAQESEEEKQITAAMKELILECTFGVIDADVYPMFDIEYVFLQLRAKSVGSKIELIVTCPDDEETTVTAKIDLDEISVQMSVGHNTTVKLTDDIALTFRYPRLKDLEGMNNDLSDVEKTLIMIYECLESVTSGDEVTNRVDTTKAEVLEFIDTMNNDQLQMIMEFFETMPKLRHVVDVINPKTKVKSEVLLEGLESFLE